MMGNSSNSPDSAVDETQLDYTELVQQKHSAELASKNKSYLLATLSEQLRAPLNAILGMTQLLLAHRELEKQEQTHMLKLMMQSGNEVLAVIEHMQDFARLDTPNSALTLKPVYLLEVIQQLMQQYYHKAQQQQIQLTLNHPEIMPAWVNTDLERLKQILACLLQQAITLNDAGTLVIDISPAPKNHSTQWTVSIGLKDKEALKAHTRPVLADLTRLNHLAPQQQAMEFALITAATLAQQLGGDLEIALDDNSSYFKLGLPLAEQPHYINQEAQALKLLIISDDEAQTAQFLAHFNHHQLQADTMTEAKARLQFLQDKIPPQLYDGIIIFQANFNQHAAYLARTLTSSPYLQHSIFILATQTHHYDYEIEQALAAGYHQVIAATEPTAFTHQLINTCQAGLKHSQQLYKNHITLKSPEIPTILVVEDNPISQKVVKTMLTDLNYQVTTATTGYQALELMSQHRYDLIFMDIGLPDISGLEVIKQYRQQEAPEQRTPIIILSAHAIEQQPELNFIHRQIDGYLLKPLMLDKLHALLKQWF